MHIHVGVDRRIPLVNMFLKGREGATSIEYALIGMLIFLTIVVAVTLLSQKVIALYTHSAAHIEAAIGGS
jgi:Flp pilus assembly pilin Flp